jgi:hypothetical protein
MLLGTTTPRIESHWIAFKGYLLVVRAKGYWHVYISALLSNLQACHTTVSLKFSFNYATLKHYRIKVG